MPEPGQNATPTLPEVRSELVQLDVTVTDKDGHNVSGLSVRDFVLLEDGRLQPLSHFAVGGRPALESAAPALTPPAAPAAPPAAPPPPAAARGRHVVLLVDDLHTAQANLPQAQIAMRKFVTEQVSVDDRVAVVTTSGSGGVFQDFTERRAALFARSPACAAATSRSSAGRPYLTEHQAELIDRGDVEALRVATQEILQTDDYLGEEMAKQQAYMQAHRMVVEIAQRSSRALGVIESVVRGLEPLTAARSSCWSRTAS